MNQDNEMMDLTANTKIIGGRDAVCCCFNIFDAIVKCIVEPIHTSSTAMDACMGSLFNKLHTRLITFLIVGLLCQRLIARNVRKLFPFNSYVSHFFIACGIIELSRGSL